MKNLMTAGTLTLAGILMTACASTATTSTTAATAETETKTMATTETAPATKTAEMKDPNKKVCKMSLQSHTRFKKRICMTAAQWEENAEAAKRSAAEFQRKGAIQKRRGN